MIIFSPCCSQKAARSGTRAIVPSSFMISQITPAGASPASLARSTAASVCPERCSTPPARACNGNTCPGWTRSRGVAAGSIATRIVWARSAALIPVVTPSRASTETVKAVPNVASFRSVICRRSSSAQRSAREGEADQSAAVHRHEVDRVGRRELGGDREIALVLAILVVDDDHESAVANLLDRLLDGGERPRVRLRGRAHRRIVAPPTGRAAVPRTSPGRPPRGSRAAPAPASRASWPRWCAGSTRRRRRRRGARRP